MKAIPSTNWARILTSPVVAVIGEIEAAGGTLHAAGGRLRVTPSGVLTSDQAAALKAHRRAVELLVLVCADAGDELEARYAAFAAAFAAGSTAPALVAGLPWERGACWSCYNRLEQTRYGRCDLCSLAMRLALPVGQTETALAVARVA